MESRKLEALLMSADLGSFTKAAEVLGYTQSGLTHMMNALEREMGVVLLARGRHGVRLTEEGEQLAPIIREFLKVNAQLDETILRLAASRRETLHIAAYASVAMYWLPSILRRFRAENPNVEVEIRMADHVETPSRLLSQGKTDIIFVTHEECGGHDWLALKNDTIYAVLPPDYPIGRSKCFRIREYEGKEFLMPSQGFDKLILDIFARQGVHPVIRSVAVDDAIIVSMVEQGLGLTMMTELILRGRTERVQALPLEPHMSRELGLAVRSLEEAPSYVKKFIACTQSLIDELPPN